MADTQNKLPITVDVSVSLSKAQTAVGTDMTIIAFCTPNVDFLHGNRVRTFLTADSFNKICTAGDSVWWAGNAFFSKTKRPKQIAVGKIFTADQPAYLLSSGADYKNIAGVGDGEFTITVGGSVKTITGLDFSDVTNLADVADIINTKIEAYARCTVYNGELLIRSINAGSSVNISYAGDITEGSGTEVASILGLTAEKGATAVDGYTAGTIAEELQAIADAGVAAGLFFYGWALDAQYRDTADQALADQWINARSYRACGAQCTNNPSAYNPGNATNNGTVANANGYVSINYTYDDNAQVYPEISYLANFLAVDYSGTDTTISGKFKDADGIAAVNFPDIETNVQTLNSRRINTITGIVGQSIKYFREGNQSSATWSTDGWVNVCNFIAELEIEVLNVFLRNNKVAYTNSGQNLLIAAASKICNKYKKNGSFADRLEEDSTAESGYVLVPACKIDIQELAATTTSQRAAHIGTPLTITVNDSGWMGSIAINVNVVA